MIRGGIGLRDFEALTPSEWQRISAEIVRVEELRERSKYERMRTVAFSAVSPYLKTGLGIMDFLPLPWDNDNSVQEAKSPTATEVTAGDVERIAKRFGDE